MGRLTKFAELLKTSSDEIKLHEVLKFLDKKLAILQKDDPSSLPSETKTEILNETREYVNRPEIKRLIETHLGNPLTRQILSNLEDLRTAGVANEIPAWVSREESRLA